MFQSAVLRHDNTHSRDVVADSTRKTFDAVCSVVFVLKINSDKKSSLRVNVHLHRVRNILQLTQRFESLNLALWRTYSKVIAGKQQ